MEIGPFADNNSTRNEGSWTSFPTNFFFAVNAFHYSLVDEKPLKQLSKKNIKQLYDKWRPASTSPHVATCRNTPSQHWRSTSFRSSRLSAEVLCVQLSSAAPSGPEPTQTGSMIGRARIVGL